MGWGGIARLGLVQAAIGSIVVLATSTLNRVMVVELALPAVFPGLLVALHYAVQMARTRVGHGSDVGGRLTSWIVGGMGVLAIGGVGAAGSVALMAVNRPAGMIAAIAAYTVIGLGVGACGTSLLVLLAKSVDAARRPAAATLTWVMMFVGFVITTAVAGQLLDPYSHSRLVAVVAAISLADWAITWLVMWRVEARTEFDGPERALNSSPEPALNASAGRKVSFRQALTQVWGERSARHFTIFVFISMLAYSGQELLLEPFFARVFQLSPGQSARMASLQHAGALIGMVLVAVLGTLLARLRGSSAGVPSMRGWTAGGCLASALTLTGLIVAALGPTGWPLRENVLLLGVANGVFAVAAIGSMMSLVSAGGPERQGLRMGLWGAAQAIAFALGGAVSSAAVDLATPLFDGRSPAYALVFAAQATLFLVAAVVAVGVGSSARADLLARRKMIQHGTPLFDVVVVGGGPAGSTAATDLSRRGYSVLLLDRGRRIKPCGGAIPPKLVDEFEIPASLLVTRVTGARMVSPASERVDMPIDGSYVGMVDRETFDEWLRERARLSGCVRRCGVFESLRYDSDGLAVIRIKQDDTEIRARAVIGADGAQSAVARQCMPSASRPPFVAAYHEIVQAPPGPTAYYDPSRCDVFYQGELSPDFYAWIFPHGETVSIGVGSARKGFSLRRAVDILRQRTGLDLGTTVRCEGAPIPLRPLKRWDDGRRVVLAGDAAGVVAPASGEGIYYAMAGGRYAAAAADRFLATGEVGALRSARRRFMKSHGRVFFILGMMQRFWYSSDRRRERFVSICKDPDVQRLTWEAYMHKRLTRSRPLAHVRIFFKDLMHLAGVART